MLKLDKLIQSTTDMEKKKGKKIKIEKHFREKRNHLRARAIVQYARTEHS